MAANVIEAAQRAAAEQGLGVDLRVGAAEEIPTGYDAIFVMDVLEHVENPAEFLRQLAEKATPDVIHLPVEQSIAHLIRRAPSQSLQRFAHIQFYSFETAQLLIAESPFRVVAHQFSGASWATVRLTGSIPMKAARALRCLAYRAAPRATSLLAGGTVLWLLENSVGPISDHRP